MDGNRNHSLTFREFHDTIGRLESRIDKRFDTVDEGVSELRERVAVVEAREAKIAEDIMTTPPSIKRQAVWGSAAASVGFALYEIAKRFVK